MILCCGDALIDMLPARTAQDAPGFVPHCGGAVYNTARALGRLGVPTGMLTGLSRDLFGQLLAQGLIESNVDTRQIVFSDRPTTLAFVEFVQGDAHYHFYDENSAGRMLDRGHIAALPDTVSALYFGGISLACEPAADTYAALLSDYASQKVIMLDPNIRPGFISNTEKYRHRLATMIAPADIVKVSDADLNWLIPDPLPLDEKARALQHEGTPIVIVTRGKDGAIAYLKTGRRISRPAKPVEVVDTVGAGDTFNAGVLAKLAELDLLQKDSLQNISRDHATAALDFGAQVAAVTVSRAGADPPWAGEL